jgi:hypothetical protein
MVHRMHSLAAAIPQSSMRRGQPFSMTTPQDLTRLTASDDASARREAVQLFLRTGDYDPKFPAWTGNVIERETKGMDDMLQALVAEVKKLSGKFGPVSIPADLVAFTREKVEPMVRGLFRRDEQDTVLAVLEKSVVFLTPTCTRAGAARVHVAPQRMGLGEPVSRQQGRKAARARCRAHRRLERRNHVLRLASLLRRCRPIRRFRGPRGRAHLPQLQASHDRAGGNKNEGMAARHQVPEARDLRLRLRGVRTHPRTCAKAA